MTGFIKSFSPLLKRFRKYLIEIILLTVALTITVSALAIYTKNNQAVNDQEIITNSKPEQVMSGKIFVDVSGAIKKPNVYQISFGARLKDIIDKGGGLSDDADRQFFNRNFNLARIVSDQEKIYIPSVIEIENRVFIQNQRTLDYVSPTNNQLSIINDQSQININSSTLEELDQLPGVGQTTANKIIDNRLYSSIEELLTKKVVNKGVFEKIKGQISTN